MLMKKQQFALISLVLLPLLIICIQLYFQLSGVVGYSLYKLAFIIPPIAYLWHKGVSLNKDIWQWQNWSQGFWPSLGTGVIAIIIFWGVYALFGSWFVDEALIVQKMSEQFSVTAQTVLLIAPITIIINSLLEESFYRGFGFGRLYNFSSLLAFLVPSIAFSIQHLLFIYHWLPFEIIYLAAVVLLLFAIVASELYRHFQTIVARNCSLFIMVG